MQCSSLQGKGAQEMPVLRMSQTPPIRKHEPCRNSFADPLPLVTVPGTPVSLEANLRLSETMLHFTPQHQTCTISMPPTKLLADAHNDGIQRLTRARRQAGTHPKTQRCCRTLCFELVRRRVRAGGVIVHASMSWYCLAPTVMMPTYTTMMR